MTFKSINDPEHLYFITASVCGWKNLFTEPAYANIVLGCLDWLRHENRMYLFAYVLMPSHLHAIVKPINRSIGDLLQDFGSFTAHAIIKQLKFNNRTDLLEFFHAQHRDPRHKHSIWQDIQAKNVYSIEFLREKLEYIHSNPVRDKWQIVDERENYSYSSARYYDRGEIPIIPVDDVREWF